MSSLRGSLPAFGSIGIHLLVAAIIGSISVRRLPPADEPVQISVVDAPAKPPPPEEKKPEPPPPPKPKPAPLKIARAPKPLAPPAPVKSAQPPPQPSSAPPPPTVEAKVDTPPVVLPGISYESTTRGGNFAVNTGNTLYGDPGRTGRDPSTVKSYKAARYAPSAQVTEMVDGGCDREVIRRYYPEDARRREVTGDVVLKLLIDSDGSIAKVDVVSDPGEGLGAAAVRTVRDRGCRFKAAKVNGEAVATTITFVVHFTLD